MSPERRYGRAATVNGPFQRIAEHLGRPPMMTNVAAALALARGVSTMTALRLAGQSCGLITCEGKRPALTTGGEVRVGRLSIRSVTARVELGAVQGATLVIGERVYVNQGSSIVAHKRIEIGDDVRIGDFVAIFDTNFHAVAPGETVEMAPVVIGSGAWLGRNVVVLPGSIIEEHAVIGAGSLVHGRIPRATLAAGSPAQVIRAFDVADGWVRT